MLRYKGSDRTHPAQALETANVPERLIIRIKRGESQAPVAQPGTGKLPAPADQPGTEVFQTLRDQVGRKSPIIPPEQLVQHVLAIVPVEEWPTRVAAMDAILRRLDSAHHEDLRIFSRPEGGRLLGTYQTRRKGSAVRPYHTVLVGVEPIAGRCDCPDYLKNSLGLCKHLCAVLEHVHAKPGRLAKALREQAAPAAVLSGLSWNPIRPLTGLGDWLERIAWHGPIPTGKSAVAERRTKLLRRFRKADGDVLAPAWAYSDKPAKRLALVEGMLDLIAPTQQANSPDPAVLALLTIERDRLATVARQAPKTSEIRAALKQLKRPLYPYQREGVDRFLACGRLLLADDMGLGKTAQAIACAHVLQATGRIRRGLIIAPASLKPQWAREWAGFTDATIEVVEGTPAERRVFYDDQRDGIFIINYEQLLRDLEPVRRWGPQLVVLDEAQRIKNWATKTALSVKGLDPPFRLVLTGTPMENRIEELASVVEWVDEHAMEPKWRLPALHAVRADGRKEVVGVRHLDTLRERLRPAMIRRTRLEVLDQLPPRTDTRIPVEMTEAQLVEHDSLNQPIASLVQVSSQRPLTQAEFLRLMSLLTTQRIISNGLCQLHFEDVWPSLQGIPPDDELIRGLNAPKLLELRQIVQQIVLRQGRKAVIFSQWRRMLDLARWATADLLAEEDLIAGAFTGAEGTKRRNQNIVEFHEDPRFRILFASDAGGVGLNLQHASNCVVNIELPWNPAVLEQRIGRIYRLGQTRPIDVYNLVSEQGIESRIAGLVGSKQAFFKGLFDGESDTVKFEQSGSFLSRVQSIYSVNDRPGSGAADIEDLDVPGIELEDTFDDGLADPFEALVEAGDERVDSVSKGADDEPPPRLPSTGPHAPESGPVLPPAPDEVRQLFSRLQVRRRDDGGVTIDAPAETALTLRALFEGMAAMLQSAAGRDDRPES